MKSQKLSNSFTSGSSSFLTLPYQTGLKIQALILKLRKEEKSLLELFSETENHHKYFLSEDEFLEAQGISSALCDLFANGWDIDFPGCNEDMTSYSEIKARLIKPEMLRAGETINDAKNRAREGLMLGVRQNLAEKATQDFLISMESPKNKLPILENLIDDPKALAKDLKKYQQKKIKITEFFDPYIQFVEENKIDEYSGHKLSEIWRYCRLTWSMEYKTNPGRSIRILIRNKARHGHPVIGIAMLASPVIALTSRDDFIGTTYEPFLLFLKDAKISLHNLVSMMEETFKAEKKLIMKKALESSKNKSASKEQLMNIIETAQKAREEALANKDEKLAEDLLFRSKRAIKLSKLEDSLNDLKLLKSQIKSDKLKLKDVDQNSYFIALVKKYLTQKRADVISTDIMDVSVCGAIFPYNSLLTGKLTALLMSSTEVKNFVDQKYKDSLNIISTKMAGRKVSKPTNLVGLTTTSLFGVGSSQYNRLKLTNINSDIKNDINWQELASTKGYGTFHFSKRTKNLAAQIDFKKNKFQHVNYKFGEGASPALRRIKEGLKEIGFDQEVIKHEYKRKTYFCDLSKNIKKEIFLKRSKNLKLNSASNIFVAWQKRFFDKRIQNDGLIDAIEKLKKEDFKLSSKLKK